MKAFAIQLQFTAHRAAINDVSPAVRAGFVRTEFGRTTILTRGGVLPKKSLLARMPGSRLNLKATYCAGDLKHRQHRAIIFERELAVKPY